MNPTDEDRMLGEYRLKELRAENSLSRTWLAEQVSVSRRVLVDELRPEQAHHRDAFLADIRAKASVDHPLIGSVYEAVADPDQCFFAHELLPGATFDDRRRAAEPFKPARLAHLLRRVSEAHIQHETMGHATAPFELEHIHLDDHGVIRLDNRAIAGTRLPDQSARDIAHLGQALVPLVADGQSGSTRMLTLLGWMRGVGLEAPISWEQVRDLCEQIEQQLADPLPPTAPTKHVTKRRNFRPLAISGGLGALVALIVLALNLYPRSKSAQQAPRSRLPQPILIPAGKHPTPDGTEEQLQAYRISAHEVTIGQYAEFLETLEILAKDQRDRKFDHENQPPEKTSHLPDDWPALFAAAKTNTPWNNLPVTLDSPVVGVDWWDAAAYAEWQRCRLATQEEWFAALRMGFSQPATLKPSAWMPVTNESADRTPQGLLGMAGSVCEWTSRPVANPANPLGERKWLLIGGSHLKPGSNALTREWIDDRSLRRPDLGFRVVFDAK